MEHMDGKCQQRPCGLVGQVRIQDSDQQRALSSHLAPKLFIFEPPFGSSFTSRSVPSQGKSADKPPGLECSSLERR